MILHIVRQTLAGVDALLELSVRDISSDNQRSRKAKPRSHRVSVQGLADLVHRLIQVHLHHLSDDVRGEKRFPCRSEGKGKSHIMRVSRQEGRRGGGGGRGDGGEAKFAESDLAWTGEESTSSMKPATTILGAEVGYDSISLEAASARHRFVKTVAS